MLHYAISKQKGWWPATLPHKSTASAQTDFLVNGSSVDACSARSAVRAARGFLAATRASRRAHHARGCDGTRRAARNASSPPGRLEATSVSTLPIRRVALAEG